MGRLKLFRRRKGRLKKVQVQPTHRLTRRLATIDGIAGGRLLVFIKLLNSFCFQNFLAVFFDSSQNRLEVWYLYPMICFPNGKINLGLRALSKRTDGFHDIETFIYPIPVRDALEFLPADVFQLTVSGIHIAGETADNLIFKAWELLCQHSKLPPVRVHLYKAIPVQSGLGGGSADAAFFIRAANVFFALGMDGNKMRNLAGRLGSDCPFFIENTPALAGGKGEILQTVNVNLKGKYLLIVKPEIAVSSREAYGLVQPGIPETDLTEIIAKPIEQWRDILRNDFEDPVFRLHPEIGEIKNSLYKMGAVFSAMTGSGSAVFGIFNHRPDSKEINPKYYLWHGNI